MLTAIYEEIERKHPELLLMTPEEKRREFDEISATAAERNPYKTLEEFEQAMRGDGFGLIRY